MHKYKYQMDPKPNDTRLYSNFCCANAFSFIWIAEVNIAVTKLEVRNSPARYSQEKCCSLT